MSIEKLRVFLEKSGCAVIVSVIIALVFVFSMINLNCGSKNNVSAQGQALVATIGSYQITEPEVEEKYQQIKQMFSKWQEGSSPIQETEIRAHVLTSLIDQGLTRLVAEQQGVKFTDDQIIHEVEQELAKSIEQFKVQLTLEGKLKPNSTQKEFEEFFKKQTGKDIVTFKKDQIELLKKEIKKPAAKASIEAKLAKDALVKKLAAKIPVDEAVVKQSYNTLVLKEILFSSAQKEKESAKARAEKVMQEIKSGLSFEEAMKKYGGTTAIEKTAPYPMNYIQSRKDTLGPLLGLKPGEVSAPIASGPNYALYKLVKVENSLPKDFDQKKAEYFKKYIENMATEKVQDDVKRAKEEHFVKWNSPGYQVLYDYIQTMLHPGQIAQKPEELNKKFEALAKKAEEAQSSPVGSKTAALTRYAIVENLWMRSNPDQRKKLINQKIDAINTLLNKEKVENVELRLELTQLYLDEKDPGAGIALVLAAEYNNSFGPSGQFINQRISDLLGKLESAKVISQQDIKKVKDSQAGWQKEKVEFEAYQEEQRKKAEEEKKKDALAKPNTAPLAPTKK